MLLNRTLFIVGAGGSHEFGLPVGAALAEQIAKALDFRSGSGFEIVGTGDRVILRELQKQSSNLSSYLAKCHVIRDGIPLSYSIDNFLDKHADDAELQLCGRMGIVRCILKTERSSSLFFDTSNIYNSIDFPSVSNTWLASLFRMLQVGRRASALSGFFSNCQIITFNYDRCIQHFFYHALQRNYAIDGSRAAEIVNSLDLIHVYGRIGSLPWERRSKGPGGAVAFGEERAPLSALTTNIMTYADEAGDDEKRQLIRSWVSGAETIIFLGFSYQGENLDLLTPQQGSAAQHVFGSCLKISEFNRAAIQRDLDRRFSRADGSSPTVSLAAATCDGTLNEFSRALI